MKKIFTVIALSIAVIGSAQTSKKWQGANSVEWDYVSSNWLPLEGLPLPTTFAENDKAVFDDSRFDKEEEEKVQVVGTVSASEVEVNNSVEKPYVFSGDSEASITGAGKLIKNGEGELKSSVLNTLEGGTVVQGGLFTMESVSSPNVFGSLVTFEGGSIQIGAGSSSSYSNIDSNLLIEEGEEGTIITSRYSNINNTLSGAGTFNFVSRGERVFLHYENEDTDWSGFTGQLNVVGDYSHNAGYAGLGFKSSKTWDATEGSGAEEDLANAKVHLQDGGGLYSESGERCYVFGELSGDATSFIRGYMKSSTTPGIYYKVGGLNTNSLVESQIRPEGSSNVTIGGETVSQPRRDNRVGIIKEGTGTYTFTNGQNFISGGINVLEGKVLISNEEGTRSGTGYASGDYTVVWVQEGAALGGTGRISGHVDVYGTLEPGDEGLGVLTVKDFEQEFLEDGKNPRKLTVRLRETSTLQMELSTVENSDKLVTDSIRVSTGSTLEVKLASAYNLTVGDVIQLWDASISHDSDVFETITLPMVAEGWEWDTSTLMETGTITLVKGGGEVVSIGKEAVQEVAGVYPNPSNGTFTVELADNNGVSVEVYNSGGQLVFSQPVNSNEVSVSLNNNAAGIYIVKINTTNGTITKKIVVR